MTLKTPSSHPAITALLADDEPNLLRHLELTLAKLWPQLQITHRARNGRDAARLIAEHRPDVAFLDIQMPGLTGLEVAQGIEGRTRVVFVTAFNEFAVRAFEQEAIDYVLKPLSVERLQRTVERVQRAFGPVSAADPATPGDQALARVLRQLLVATPGDAAAAKPGAPARLRYVRASCGDLTTQVPIDEVLLFHADDKYTVVRTVDAEHLIRTPISELLAQLDPGQFWQVHRSTIVNADAVAGTRRDELSRLFVRIQGLVGEWPVSRAYVHLFRPM